MKEQRVQKPRTCGSCRWYDALGDVCRNGSSPREWEVVDRRESCKKWEREPGPLFRVDEGTGEVIGEGAGE